MKNLRLGRFRMWILAGLLANGFSRLDSRLHAADFQLPADLQKKVNESISRAKKFLLADRGGAEGSLVAYALVKAGTAKDSPMIAAHRDVVLRKIANGAYGSGLNPPPHHVYEAACDAMFLESLDSAKYELQLTVLRDYLIARQLKTGAWYYPTLQTNLLGDTSITQYAVLGLWAVQRAGIDVPREVLSNAAKYHAATQQPDGGFGYHPFFEGQRATTTTMTAAGLGSTLVARLLVYGASAESEPSADRRQRRFGVLEQRSEQSPTESQSPRKTPGESLLGREAFKKVIDGAERALEQQLKDGLAGTGDAFKKNPSYFLYGCERVGALTGSEKFGSIHWYEAGADFLLKRQDADGSWGMGQAYSARADTAFCLLFLTRATESLVPSQRRPRKVGGGLLVGGRGLPDDLASVTLEDGEVQQRTPEKGVDTLLAELEHPEEVSVRDVQKSIVEAVQLDRPEQLIGEIERLHRLLSHPEPEVRQVAVWALARSRDFRESPRLIEMLEDPDLVVAWEASLGLCILSRMPSGVIQPDSGRLVDVAPPGVEADVPDPAADKWRTQAKAAWTAWYQSVRPYEERDDRPLSKTP